MTAWHVDDAQLRMWIEGSDGSLAGASVEQHLLGCAHCRSRVSAAVRAEAPRAVPDLEQVWSGIRDAVELPRPSRLERLLTGVGLSPADAKLVAAAPSLQGAWLTGLMFVFVFVGLAAMWGDSRGQALFLMVAPLVPMAGVALSYGPEVDPALEQEAATSYPALRLVLLRSVAVLAACLPVAIVGGPVLPAQFSYLWLLPAAGFTAAVLALSTWLDPIRAGTAITIAWCGAVSSAAWRGSAGEVLRGPFLAGYAALAVVALAVLVVRGRHLDELRGIR